MKLSVRETAFVLAGLRSLQDVASEDDGLPEHIVELLIAGDIDGDRINLEEIDELCGRLSGE